MTKKTLFQSYLSGITDRTQGERYSTIIGYFLPELVTAFLLNSVLSCVNTACIGHLCSTSLYATMCASTIFIQFLDKIADGLCIGTVVLCGHFNGLKRYIDAGKSAMTAFWVTFCIGGIIALALYFGAYRIYAFLQVPESMVEPGVAYLRLRSFAIFLSFIHFALIGFLRGIKNTRVPMLSFLAGGACFIFFDYALIFGKFGFPKLELYGAAVAAIIQYLVMLSVVLGYLFFDRRMRQYDISLEKGLSSKTAATLLELSWPVIIDKAVLAVGKIWLVRLIAPMGAIPLATFGTVREMEMFAFVPAIAFAQVITFLVSNDYGGGNWLGIKNNIKKVIFMSSLAVSIILIIFSLFPQEITYFFMPGNNFASFAAVVFPMISVLVVLDILQLILAGALRGAANVRVVMITRLIVGFGLFIPLSYVCSIFPFASQTTKFIFVYGSYYVTNGIMSLVYVLWFRRDIWKNKADVRF